MTSAAFEPGGVIPNKYTCDGQDISPPLLAEGELMGRYKR
jgi:phosphatidylethanolamine-binding protein (PEBP) family uncharacterized protein